jgi:hypothetical protein
MAITLPAGMKITGEILPAYEDILTPEALALVDKLHRAFEPRRQELLAARVSAPSASTPARCPTSCRKPRHPRRRLEGRAGAEGAGMPPRGNHRPGRSQDGHQRLQLGR